MVFVEIPYHNESEFGIVSIFSIQIMEVFGEESIKRKKVVVKKEDNE